MDRKRDRWESHASTPRWQGARQRAADVSGSDPRRSDIQEREVRDLDPRRADQRDPGQRDPDLQDLDLQSIDPGKIRRAREILGSVSAAEAIEVALDLLVLDDTQCPDRSW